MNRHLEGNGRTFTLDPDDVEALEPHPTALLVPEMGDEEFEHLKSSIRQWGLLEPIVLLEDKVLDGRHRLRACLEVGAVAAFVEWDEPPDVPPILWVLATNAHRRHLTPSQRAILAVTVRDRLVAEDSRVPWSVPGCTPHTPHSTPLQGGTGEPTASTASHKSEAARQVASALAVSPTSLERAEHVVTWGDPALIDAVQEDRVSLYAAEAVAELPEEDQRELLRRVEPRLLRQEARRLQDERKAEQRRRREERAASQAAAAAAAAPTFEGIEIVCGTAADLVRDLEGVRLVHADPPWTYSNHGNGSAESHYDTMVIDDILDDLEAAWSACADDAVLVLWATWPILGELFHELGERLSWPWGPPVSGGAWAKTGRLGVGHWWRGQSEPVLLFTKGRPAVTATIGNAHISPRADHSEKPEEWLRHMLAAWCPPGGLVADLYAGRAPMARACLLEGRRYVGRELDPVRHAEALALLEGARVAHDLAGDAVREAT